ncbi:MAG: hypothetical protein ACJ8DI_05085 [Ktedonobacteraceae bacterium]
MRADLYCADIVETVLDQIETTRSIRKRKRLVKQFVHALQEVQREMDVLFQQIHAENGPGCTAPLASSPPRINPTESESYFEPDTSAGIAEQNKVADRRRAELQVELGHAKTMKRKDTTELGLAKRTQTGIWTKRKSGNQKPNQGQGHVPASPLCWTEGDSSDDFGLNQWKRAPLQEISTNIPASLSPPATNARKRKRSNSLRIQMAHIDDER